MRGSYATCGLGRAKRVPSVPAGLPNHSSPARDGVARKDDGAFFPCRLGFNFIFAIQDDSDDLECVTLELMKSSRTSKHTLSQ